MATSNASTTNTTASTGLGSCAIAQGLTDSVSNGQQNFNVGDTVTYFIQGAPAFTAPTAVTVTSILPAGLTFVSSTPSVGTYDSAANTWNVGTLNGAGYITLTITATVNAGTEGQTIATAPNINFVQSNCTESSAVAGNTITINGTPIVTSTSTPVADLSIIKTANVTSTTEGGTIDYSIAVTDLGPATSTGVVATDTLPAGLTFVSATTSEGSYASSTGTWNIGDMPASSTATLNIAATVNSGEAGMTITNTAIVAESASSTDNNLANNSSSVSLTVQPVVIVTTSTPIADLSVSKTADVTSTVEGGTINYTIAVTDLGPATSTGVVATDTLPSGLTFENATASVGTYASSTGAWTIGDLSANATATLQIAAQVNTGTAGTTITNTAIVAESASSTDSNMANNSSSVSIPVASNACTSNCGGGTSPTSTIADIGIAKTVDNASPSEGNTVNYTLTVSAFGPATSTGVVATDTLPAGLTFVSATTSEGSYASSTGTWTIGDMSASSTATLTIAATVNAGEAGMTITNTGLVGENATDTDNNLANNSSSVSITVAGGGGGGGGCTSNCGGGGGSTPTADISIVKTVDNANPSTGDSINYTLTVSDAGPYASNGVVATDTLPSGLTFVSATTSEGSYASSTGTWNIGSVIVGTSTTLVITATVNASAGTQITNTASVSESSATIDPNLTNNSSSVTVTVAGGGGGGGGSGGGGAPVGEGSSGGEVLGASCGLYLDQYIHPVRQSLNDSTEVEKLQVFLNMNLGDNLSITGQYNESTIQAVDQFQVKYHSEVLTPWVPLGLATEYTPTGYVYQTTQRWINLIMCPSLNIPMPTLVVDQGGE